MRPRPAWAGIAVGAAGFAGGLVATYTGMRDVIQTTGGSCASGGPYEISRPCPQGDAELLLGVLGMVVAGFVLAGFVSRCDGSVTGVGLVMWAALFGALGFNFLDVGESLVMGGIFELMALGGLIPAIVLMVGWLRHPEEHGKPVFDYSGIVVATRSRR
ncbi:MAG: hypothetical protein ACJ762_21515 [Solirubrobacteraceae bacterium]